MVRFRSKQAGTAVILFVALLVFAWAVLSRVSDPASRAGNSTYTDESGVMTVESGKKEIPKAFPSSFPLYPESRVGSALDTDTTDSGHSIWVSQDSDSSVAEISEFYEKALSQSGWEIPDRITLIDGNTWTIQSAGWQGTLAVSSAKDGEGSLIVIVLAEHTGEDMPPEE